MKYFLVALTKAGNETSVGLMPTTSEAAEGAVVLEDVEVEAEAEVEVGTLVL